MEFLSVRDGKLVQGGREVTLRGFGLGGWLLPEGYLWKLYQKCDRPRRMEAMIEALCGADYAAGFWPRYYAAYLTQDDIRLIAERGFNCVRLPINARHAFQSGRLNQGYMGHVDDCLAWCTKYGVYLILDLHAAPGGQTGQNIDDSENDLPELFMDGGHQDELTSLWTLLARRYRDCPALAGYDLLNEPLMKKDARYYGQLLPLYFRLTDAIRKVDPRHVVIWEGAHWATDFSVFDALSPDTVPDNIMLQFHKYWSPPDRESLRPFLLTAERLGLPLYCGEAGENNCGWYTTFFPLLDRCGISWSFWSYKKMGVRNSVSVFPQPPRWNELLHYLDGGPKPERPEELFDSFLSCIRRPEIQTSVLAALARRAPVRIPAEAYDACEAVSPKESGVLLRGDEPISLVFADGHTGEPDYRRYGGEPQPERERIYVRLSRGDAVSYCVTMAALNTLTVRVGGEGRLRLSCGGVRETSTVCGFTILRCSPRQEGPQRIECRCEAGRLLLDEIEILET